MRGSGGGGREHVRQSTGHVGGEGASVHTLEKKKKRKKMKNRSVHEHDGTSLAIWVKLSPKLVGLCGFSFPGKESVHVRVMNAWIASFLPSEAVVCNFAFQSSSVTGGSTASTHKIFILYYVYLQSM